MESLEHIKNRLGSVKNIGEITRAMELVAEVKSVVDADLCFSIMNTQWQ